MASSEVELFRVEGEAVILSFPMFSRVLKVRKIAPASARLTISKGNGSAPVAAEDRERVVQSNKQLWLLPAKASDSGEYTCTYRYTGTQAAPPIARNKRGTAPCSTCFI